ncbi:hypothetical protein SLEP1_g49425 [Rubroshorea leprosula]|nr:hypothetical protein SLEP1_g49425 [Rubroshorea leprosula]
MHQSLAKPSRSPPSSRVDGGHMGSPSSFSSHFSYTVMLTGGTRFLPCSSVSSPSKKASSPMGKSGRRWYAILGLEANAGAAIVSATSCAGAEGTLDKTSTLSWNLTLDGTSYEMAPQVIRQSMSAYANLVLNNDLMNVEPVYVVSPKRCSFLLHKQMQ